MTRRRDIIQRIRHAVIVRTAPLCIVGLGCRIHGREARDRRTGEGRVVIPALKGIAVPERREHIDVAAAVCEHRVARKVRCRVGCRVTRRASVVQHIVNRIRNRRAVPLCKVVLILCVHGVQVRDRRSRQCCVVVPSEEGIACPRCRMDGDIRIQNGVACDRVRIACRVSRRCVVIQIPLHRIDLCRTPLRKVLLILCVHGVQVRDRRTRERRIVVPAEEVVAGARCRLNGHIRIRYGIACDRIWIVCRVSRRCTVI